MPLFLVLLIALICVPLVELYLLLKIGHTIGAATTISLVIFTAVLGAWLLRRQGLATLARAQTSMNAGQLPAIELVEGLILLFAGVLLLTPGFITDACGFLILLPAVRRHVAAGLAERMVVRAGRPPGPRGGHAPQTIDGDFKVEDEDQRGRLR